MHKVLIIPDESYPAHQSFMAEVFSKETDLFQSVFLMRTTDRSLKKGTWNKSPVYLFPYFSKIKLLNKISTYLCMDLRYCLLIPRIVFKEKITIIQVRDMTFPLCVALFLKLITRRKVIYQKSYPMEYCRIEAAADPSHKFPKLLVKIKRLENIILHRLMRFSDAILPISKYMADNLHTDYGLPHRKMFPFGMGFNFGDFTPVATNGLEATGALRFIYLGTLERERKFDVLLQGIAQAVRSLAGKHVAFEFVGGTEEEISELKELVTKLKLQTYCNFTGYIKREEAYKKVNSSHIGISWFGTHVQFHDACPTKMMEYLAMGLPILAVDTVLMHKDILNDTKAGVLCRVEPEDVAAKIVHLTDNHLQYKEKALHSTSYIKQNFSYVSMREEIRQLYDTI